MFYNVLGRYTQLFATTRNISKQEYCKLHIIIHTNKHNDTSQLPPPLPHLLLTWYLRDHLSPPTNLASEVPLLPPPTHLVPEGPPLPHLLLT